MNITAILYAVAVFLIVILLLVVILLVAKKYAKIILSAKIERTNKLIACSIILYF